jgi:hypothetical protein
VAGAVGGLWVLGLQAARRTVSSGSASAGRNRGRFRMAPSYVRHLPAANVPECAKRERRFCVWIWKRKGSCSDRCGFYAIAIGDVLEVFIGEGFGVGGVLEEFGNGGFGEGVFDAGEGEIDAFVQGAEFDGVAIDMQGADAYARQGIDGGDDIEDGDLGGFAGEGKAAVHAALSVDEAGAIEGLEDFVKVTGRDLGDLGDVGIFGGFAGVEGEVGNDSQGVFVSLREHAAPSICRLRR